MLSGSLFYLWTNVSPVGEFTMYQLMAISTRRKVIVVLSFSTMTAVTAAMKRFMRSGYRCQVYTV